MPLFLSLALVALLDATLITGLAYTVTSTPSQKELETAYLRDRHPPLKKE